MGDKARRAKQNTGGTTWTSRQQAERDFARSHPGYQAAFDQEQYRKKLIVAFMRIVPFVAPVWIVILLMSMRRKPALQSGPSISFDDHGRAFAEDTYGNMHRLPAFDRQ